ncbi:MAG: HAD hydrolase-like protein [Desertifilum sp.]|nr:HAD hydrolase-like protein [Desertifilum sp.]
MSKLLILDKDQTLIRSRLGGDNYIQKPWDQAPICGWSEVLYTYLRDDYKIVIASNQGGVEKGFKSIESAILEMQYCLELFPQISEAFFCPDFAGKKCYRIWGNNSEEEMIIYDEDSWETKHKIGIEQYRKPKPGMLLLAMLIHGIAKDDTIFVGDRDSDKEAAAAAGVRYYHRDEFLVFQASE